MPLSNLETPQMKGLKEFCKRFGVTSLSDHGLCGFQTNETFCLYHFSTAREFQKKAHHFRWEWNDVSKEGVRGADRFGWILLHGKPDKGKRFAERFFLAPRKVFVIANSAKSSLWPRTTIRPSGEERTFCGVRSTRWTKMDCAINSRHFDAVEGSVSG